MVSEGRGLDRGSALGEEVILHAEVGAVQYGPPGPQQKAGDSAYLADVHA